MSLPTAAEDLVLGLTGVIGLPALTEAAGAPLAAEDIAALVEEAARFTAEKMAPHWQEADRHGATYANGTVTVPPHYRALMQDWIDSGWQGVAAPVEHGGQGLPHALWIAVTELASAADMAFFLGPVLTAGAIDLLVGHATPDQSARWLPQLVSGSWTGTMCLTEPQAGSDLAALRCRAEPLGEGRYALHGQKIYITWGEHDLTENILHLVLARLPGAPEGSRGISLFAAPRLLPDGSRNALRCGGIERKLGIHASPTCVMLFEGAEAELVGEPGRGLNAMFAMMNAARLAVGVQGVGQGARALALAEAYATQRVQNGRPIARHADVARMLAEMRAITLAGRLLALEAAAALDRHHLLGEEAGATRLALLTPIVKAWCTDRGVETASQGIQVHGGMGFVEDTGAAQILRDARIAPIYEGTNGIQAIDLLVRKLGRDEAAAMHALLAEVAATDPRLAATCARVGEATATLLALQARDPETAQSLAAPYLDACGWLLGGWMLVRAATASPDRAALAGFYLARLLPRAEARCQEIAQGALLPLPASP
ncbi:acyl-CoA dehydrogenase [Falsiroseomonas selenitidurans]|uniref:Acyl-CoA dehydrogenase n=1 Tax=Falsiroseomonas selenitidurans TaxID=2716335 RepID=A0ABX1EAF5_9PROT|nr:acyl-CoA dehydrogenase [Falsiroseomonas selenitidurans]NKC32753.1 acyl-CoA dehydrogenase [Falsiroseomonas selenitidurans]